MKRWICGLRILRSILVLLFVPVYSALLGSTADTCGASVYGVFHILRELVDYGSSGRFSTCSFSVFAWFNSEYKFMRQSTWLVFLVTMLLAVYSFVVLSPRCSASCPVWTRRISACARLGLLVFDDVPRAVLLLVVSSPRCPSSRPAWTTGQLCGGSQVQLLDVVVVPVVCNDKCPDPDAQYSGGAAVAVPLQGRQHPCRWAETASHGLTIQRPLRSSCCSTLT